jgi:hypothetical protein
VRTTPHSLIGWVVVGAYTTRAELREVSSVENRDITIDALTYYHDPDEMVLVLATPALNIMWFDARGKGLTHDDTAAIQATVKAAGDYGGTVNVPPAKSFWNTTYAIRVPSYVTIQGDGERSHIKHTGTAAPAWWTGYDWFAKNMFYVGNIGGEGQTAQMPTSPFYMLTWYGIAVSPAGTTRITFDTNAEADQFSVDDVVFLKSGVTFTDPVPANPGYFDVDFYRPLYVQVNIVRAVGDGFVDLVYPLNHNFDASSSIATEAEPYDLYDGAPLYYPRNVTMRDLHLEMTDTNGAYAIYAGGIYLNFENLIIDHKRHAFGADALCYSKLENITINYGGAVTAGLYPLDIATLSHNTSIKKLTMDFGGINIAETGAFITLEDFYLGYGHISSGSKHFTTIRDGKIARFDDGESTAYPCVSAGMTETEGCLVDNVTIEGVTGAKHSIAVFGRGTIVRNCKPVASPDVGGIGIAVVEAARDYIVEGNVVGKDGARSINDKILVYGNPTVNGKIVNNQTITSVNKIVAVDAVVKSTTGDTTLKTASFIGGQFRYANAVKLTAFGTVAGTNDAKTIALKTSAVAGTPAMATISLAAGETGDWKIEAILIATAYGTPSGIRCNSVCLAPDETIEQHDLYISNAADLTADWDITLVGNLASASDAINLYGWFVEPLQDQYTF